jgi:signal peptidase II
MKVSFGNMAVLVTALIGLDQLVKWLVETRLEFQTKVEVIPYLGLYRTWNEGIAFSWLWGLDGRLLIVMTAAITLFVMWLARQTQPENWLARLGFSLIIAGAIGNMIDRSIYNHVVDYILFHTPSWSFAVFNLADVFISVGAGAIILSELLDWRASRSNR